MQRNLKLTNDLFKSNVSIVNCMADCGVQWCVRTVLLWCYCGVHTGNAIEKFLNRSGIFKIYVHSQSAIFCACKYAIKDADDVLPAKDGPCCPYW